MGVGAALHGALILLACGGEPALRDTGFQVTGSYPAHGDEDVVEAVLPELHLNREADPETCTAEVLGLVALNDDDSVAFAVEATPTPTDEGRKLVLDHGGVLPGGWRYAYAVRSGAAGCTDLAGHRIEPFHAEFLVP